MAFLKFHKLLNNKNISLPHDQNVIRLLNNGVFSFFIIHVQLKYIFGNRKDNK